MSTSASLVPCPWILARYLREEVSSYGLILDTRFSILDNDSQAIQIFIEHPVSNIEYLEARTTNHR